MKSKDDISDEGQEDSGETHSRNLDDDSEDEAEGAPAGQRSGPHHPAAGPHHPAAGPHRPASGARNHPGGAHNPEAAAAAAAAVPAASAPVVITPVGAHAVRPFSSTQLPPQMTEASGPSEGEPSAIAAGDTAQDWSGAHPPTGSITYGLTQGLSVSALVRQRMGLKPSPRPTTEISREELHACFHLPSEQACKKLGIGLTVLKRQCRKYGIRRWPFRKMKSLDRLIENIQQSVSPDEQTPAFAKSVEELQSQKQRMEAGLELELNEETKKLQQAYSKANHKLRRQYQIAGSGDDEGSHSSQGTEQGEPTPFKSVSAHASDLLATYMQALPGKVDPAQMEQFTMALSAMLAAAQNAQGQSTAQSEGEALEAALRSKADEQEDDKSPAGSSKGISKEGQPAPSKRPAQAEEAEDPEARAKPAAAPDRRSKSSLAKTPRNKDVIDALVGLADAAELEEAEKHKDHKGSTKRSSRPHYMEDDDDRAPEQLTEVEVLARLQIYAQEMGYLLQSTTVQPLPNKHRKKRSRR